MKRFLTLSFAILIFAPTVFPGAANAAADTRPKLKIEAKLPAKQSNWWGKRRINKIGAGLHTALVEALTRHKKDNAEKRDIFHSWQIVDIGVPDATIAIDVNFGQFAGNRGKNSFRLRLTTSTDDTLTTWFDESDYWQRRYVAKKKNPNDGVAKTIAQFKAYLASDAGRNHLSMLYDAFVPTLKELEKVSGEWTTIRFRMPEIGLPPDQRFESRKLRIVFATDTKRLNSVHYTELRNQNSEWFEERWPLLSPGHDFQFQLQRLRHSGYRYALQPDKVIARGRRELPENATAPEIKLHCPVAGECCMLETAPDGWASGKHCERATPSRSGGLLRHLSPIGVARAAQQDSPFWSIPPLSRLINRYYSTDSETEKTPGRDYRYTGFTEFRIQSDKVTGVDADSYALDIRINGQRILEDGIEPQYRRHSIRPGNRFFVRFGIGNISFNGRHNGCEHVRATLSFWKNGKPTGAAMALERPYGALRKAFKYRQETEYGVFTWRATYHPLPYGEYELFLGADIFNIKAKPDARSSETSVLKRQRMARDAFNELGWTVSRKALGWLNEAAGPDLRLVAILRPPLKQHKRSPGSWYSYSRALGVKLETGQIRFTFTKPEIRTIGNALIAQAKRDLRSRDKLGTGMTRRKAVPLVLTTLGKTPIEEATIKALHIYKLRGPSRNVQEEWVCNRKADLN